MCRSLYLYKGGKSLGREYKEISLKLFGSLKEEIRDCAVSVNKKTRNSRPKQN